MGKVLPGMIGARYVRVYRNLMGVGRKWDPTSGEEASRLELLFL